MVNIIKSAVHRVLIQSAVAVDVEESLVVRIVATMVRKVIGHAVCPKRNSQNA